jgi:hypothetical protein
MGRQDRYWTKRAESERVNALDDFGPRKFLKRLGNGFKIYFGFERELNAGM